MAPRITIIGGGRLACGLGRLWHQTGAFAIHDVLSRSLDDARRAVGAIGAGRAVDRYADLRTADVFLISTPDRAIAGATASLVAGGHVDGASVVFHCSGAESASVLEAARQRGAAVGSAHPVMTFSGQPLSLGQFAGTHVAIEAEPRAGAVLEAAFLAIGARPIRVSAENKLLYHAAATFCSSYLVTLVQIAIDIHGHAGIAAPDSSAMLAPLIHRSVDNALRSGARAAITGPLARGDADLVQRQFAALGGVDPQIAGLYASLAAFTARVVGVANPLG
jgi:predicted short-subunit dehydrogenase-like oxidoreductase (DUF2520 family)